MVVELVVTDEAYDGYSTYVLKVVDLSFLYTKLLFSGRGVKLGDRKNSRECICMVSSK
jgi:hypothetical protein